MKKVLKLLAFFGLPFLAVAFLPQGHTALFFQSSLAVQLPPELIAAINALFLFLVMAGLQLVFELVGIDLRGFGVAIAATISEFAIAQLQALIDVVPPQYDPLVNIGLLILLAILSAFGFFRVLFAPKRVAQLFSRE